MNDNEYSKYLVEFNAAIDAIDSHLSSVADKMDSCARESIEYDGWLRRYNALSEERDQLYAQFNAVHAEQESNRPLYID